MDTDARLKFLQGELKELIELTSRERKKNRKQALRYKILSVCFAAAITVLLGLKVDAALADIFRNIALVFGAAITVFNAIEAFYDFRSLWVNQTIFREQLFILERDINFYTFHPKQGER